MTTTCLLCPAPAVADGLCVDDGARLWAARFWFNDPGAATWAARHAAGKVDASPPAEWERIRALQALPTYAAATAFLDRYEAAKAAHAAAPLCSRGCKSHDSEEER
jgi:hypothetical protein